MWYEVVFYGVSGSNVNKVRKLKGRIFMRNKVDFCFWNIIYDCYW